MKLAEDHETRVRQVMTQVDCEKGFGCYRSGFMDVCKVRNRGPEEFLECLEEDACVCQFALSFGNGTYCLCPVRIYAATELDA
jgi:hypothetical protein